MSIVARIKFSGKVNVSTSATGYYAYTNRWKPTTNFNVSWNTKKNRRTKNKLVNVMKSCCYPYLFPQKETGLLGI